MPRLHLKFVFRILVEYLKLLQTMPAVTYLSTGESRVFTVVGDLHGQLRDLCEIFRLNGAPTHDNPYLFNGDLVDRGEQSLEVALVIFGLAVADPQAVHVNRGNHEDLDICRTYGFVEEIYMKYSGSLGKTLLELFDAVFSYLPLAAVLDNDIAVMHGGIS